MPWVAAEAWVGEVQADGTVGEGAPDRGRTGRIGVPAAMVARRRSLVCFRSWQRLVEPLSRVRRRDRADGAHGRRIRPGAVEFRDVDLRVRIGATIVCCFVRDGVWQLAQLDTRTRRFDPISLPFTSLSQLRAGPGRAVFLGGSPSEATALVELDLGTGTHRVIRRSAVLGDELRPYISVAQPVSFPTAGGETAHALYYPPLSLRFTAPAGEKPPLLVRVTAGRPRRPRAR